MTIDISRDSFDPRRHYTGVRLQQGRVQVDADWNEHAAILARQLRLMLRDLHGPHAGPEGECGFIVLSPGDALPDGGSDHDRHALKQLLDGCDAGDFVLTAGRYYVDGLMCEIDEPVRYSGQPIVDPAHRTQGEAGRWLVYLDTWEREVGALQDDAIREVALGGADTAARIQLAWVVRLARLEKAPGVNETFRSMKPGWHEHVARWQPARRGRLKARSRADEDAEPFDEQPDQGDYRGHENQLYRIEVHRGGGPADAEKPTFKWSRDNGVVALPVDEITGEGKVLVVGHWGRDDTWAFRPDDWVEVLDANAATHGRRPPDLLQVVDIDIGQRLLTLSGPVQLPQAPHGHHSGPPIVRRWDQRLGAGRQAAADFSGGACVIHEGRWLPIEDGIQVLFEPSAGHTYRRGDYWTVPARVLTADVIWPRDADSPLARPPSGVEHHYAPLAIIDVEAGQTNVVATLTRRFGYRKLDDVTGDVMARG